MNRICGIIIAVCAGLAIGAEQPEFGNILGMREYKQVVRLEFEDEAAAREAGLSMLPLPEHKTLCLSCRWDDSNVAHLKTSAVMSAHGVKGTFYENDTREPLSHDTAYIEKLLAAGNSFGNHTATHPFLSLIHPETAFWQYMFARIDIEVMTQSPVSTTVTPFCDIYNPADPDSTADIGRCIQATGMIGSPDIYGPEFAERLKVDPKSIALGFFVHNDDCNPDPADIARQTAEILNYRTLPDNPQISMTMHSWHSDEGLRNLDTIFQNLGGHDDWWYCNQNEYAAYRYEFRNDAIEKKADGRFAEFTVTRICPFELGASVPLWFDVTGAQPVGIQGAELNGNSVVLPHDPEQILPQVYYIADSVTGRSNLDGVTVRLAHDGNNWICRIGNCGAPMTDVTAAFRFGPKWKCPVIRRFCTEITDSTELSASQDEPCRADDKYRYGKSFYAVQLDFMRDGRRMRLYAVTQDAENPDSIPENCLRDSAFITPVKNEYDIAALSIPGTPMPENALRIIPNTDSFRTTVCVGRFPEEYRNTPAMYVFDFIPDDDACQESSELIGNYTDHWFLNGNELSGRTVNPSRFLRNGINRIVVVVDCPFYPTGFAFKYNGKILNTKFIPIK